jgi:hypothetical protein
MASRQSRTDMTDHVYYNDFEHPQAAKDMQRLKVACGRAQVCFELHFVEPSNLWYINITSAAPVENHMTKDRSLSIALEVAIDHVEGLIKK